MNMQSTTRRRAIHAAALIAAAVLGCSAAHSRAGAQELRMAAQPQDRELQQLNQQTRTRIQSIVGSTAGSFRVTIDPGTFVYLSRDDALLVNAGIMGADSIEVGTFRRGANVMFAYVRTPPASRIAPGFYAVRITGAPGSARAQFVTAEGRVAAEFPATLTRNEHETGGTARLRLTASVTGEGCTLDAHTRKWDLVIHIQF
ncbi:MAG TPA: hypothetical protein VM890_03215 [Longimicrobium sp.]|nr:hypothetical protein [Longimicrobium sp.]